MTYYKKIGIEDNGETLTLLTADDFALESFYFDKGIAPTPEISLRESVVEKLKEAKKLLPKGYDFKIFDGYRLLETQKQLFDGLYNYYRTHNPNWNKATLGEKTEIFVAAPRYDITHPSPHNTGGAVDLTIVDEKGEELPMGTVFDEFSERGAAFTDHFLGESENHDNREFHKNRMLLKKVLEAVGFVNYENEWWHYSYGDQMWAFQKGVDYAIYGSVELT